MKLTKVLYARKEKDGDDTYFIAGESLDDVVEESGVTTVGIYRLAETHRFRRVSELVKEG